MGRRCRSVGNAMLNIFSAFRNKLRLHREKSEERRCVNTVVITELTDELRDLVARAAQLCPEENGMAQRLKTLETELAHLGDLATRPEFCKLSTEQRLELRQGLLQVRSKILTTMQQGPSPTDFIQ